MGAPAETDDAEGGVRGFEGGGEGGQSAEGAFVGGLVLGEEGGEVEGLECCVVEGRVVACVEVGDVDLCTCLVGISVRQRSDLVGSINETEKERGMRGG